MTDDQPAYRHPDHDDIIAELNKLKATPVKTGIIIKDIHNMYERDVKILNLIYSVIDDDTYRAGMTRDEMSETLKYMCKVNNHITQLDEMKRRVTIAEREGI